MTQQRYLTCLRRGDVYRNEPRPSSGPHCGKGRMLAVKTTSCIRLPFKPLSQD